MHLHPSHTLYQHTIKYKDNQKSIALNVQFALRLRLTYASVFCQEATVIDDRIRVELDEHWSKCGEGAWDGMSTKSSQGSTSGSGATINSHTIVDTHGVCYRGDGNPFFTFCFRSLMSRCIKQFVIFEEVHTF